MLTLKQNSAMPLSLVKNTFVLSILLSFQLSSQAQDIADLEVQLSRIDSLLSSDLDSLGWIALSEIDTSMLDGRRDLLIQYHQYRGDYFLQTNDYSKAIQAYLPLVRISSSDLSKKSTLKLARAINDLGIAHMKVGNITQAKESHFTSLVLYGRFNDPMGGSYNYNNLALIYKEQKQTDSAIYFHRLSMESAELASDTLGVGYNLLNLAILYTDTKELVKALDHFHRSLSVFEQLGNERMINGVRRRLGTYYMKIGDNLSAKPLLLATMEYYKSNGGKSALGVTHNKLAELFDRLDQHDSVIYHADQALAILKETNYSKGLGASYFWRGSYYFSLGNDEEALENLEKALSFSEGRWKGEAVAVLRAKARIYLKRSEPQRVVECFEKALSEVGEDKDESSLMQIYALLSRAYKEMGDTGLSLAALEQHNKLRAKVLDDEKRWEIARIEYRNFLEREKVQQRAERLEQEAQYVESLRKKQLVIYAVIAMLLFVAAVALLYYRSYRVKRRANQFLAEKNVALKELRTKENQLAAEKIASKERELATMAMATHEKNNILKGLKEKIEGIETSTSSGSDLRDIKRSINNSLSLDESWDSFLHRFEDVHPQFFNQLKAKNQNLTINDLKLSAYLKIGMNNKEIANVTFLTLGSVKSQINRLKKKLQLGPEDNIRDFMLQGA